MTMDDIIRENELELFYESLSNSLTFDTQKILHTIDYLNLCQSKNKRRTPTCLHFCEALLMEILCNMSPENKLWDKVKYAAFLLNLANRNVKFDLLYKIFYQIEDCVQLKNLAWNSEKIRDEFATLVTEILFVKQDVDAKDINKDRGFNILDSENFGDVDFDLLNGATDAYAHEENYDNYTAHHIKEDLMDDSYDPVDYLFNDADGEVNKIEKTDEKIPKKRKRGPYKKKKKMKDIDNPDEQQDEKEVDDKTKDSDWKCEAKENVKKIKGEYLYCNENDCNYKCTTRSQLDQHAFKGHESNRLCTQCGHLADSYEQYKEHRETHIFTCEICNKSCLGAKSLKFHTTLKHGKKDDTTRTPCNVCGILILPSSLEAHISQVHGTEIHKCDVCDFTANTKSKISIHRKNHFTEMKTCPECGKSIKSAKSLKRHYRQNCPRRKDIKTFDCNLCDKQFKMQQTLDKHIKYVHQKIKDIQCQFCDYQTYSSFNLKIHISKMHTKEVLTKICLICDQKTMSLDNHMKIYHFEAYLKSKEEIEQQ